MSGNVRNLQERPYRWSTAVILLVFAAALFLRLRGLGFRDFWCDEISSIFFLEHPWRNWNAPLYWILLHFWAKIFGITEFSLRLPGALFSFFTTAIIFFLGKALFNRKTAVLAALFSGLSAFHIWYAQDARDYSMLVFFGTLSSYILVLMLKTGDYRKLKWFVAVSCAGIYTNYFMLFLVAAQILYLLAVKRLRPDKRWWFFLAIPAVFALYLPRFIGKLKFRRKRFLDSRSFLEILRDYPAELYVRVQRYAIFNMRFRCS